MKKLSLTLLVSLIALIGFSQRSTIGMNIKVYDPISKFKQNVDKSIPVGISFNYLRTKEESRYSFGGEIGVAMYSSNDYLIEYRGRAIKVNEEDCFWTMHGVVRYDLVRTDKFVSYAEARAGLTTFFSSTTPLEENTGFRGEFEFHGSAFNTGLGGGIMVRVGNNIWINGGANLHSGSRVDYRYMPESNEAISLQEGHYKSLTHYMGYRLGVSLQL